jgi:hypothetical protein
MPQRGQQRIVARRWEGGAPPSPRLSWCPPWPALRLCVCPSAGSFPLDVDRGRVVQQPVQDGAGSHVVLEDGFPIAVALVRGEDHGATLDQAFIL